MKKKDYDLGKGIAALFENVSVQNIQAEGVSQIALDKITPNPKQPRKNFSEADLLDLTQSIQRHGVIQPIVVRAADQGFEIVAGERRYRAAKSCGLATIPAVVKDFSSEESFTIALIENLQRENLNPIEEAEAFFNILKSKNITQDELANYLGKTRSYVANALRLLTLPENVQDLLKAGDLAVGHARPLIGRSDAQDVARKIVREKMSAREVERMCRQDTGSDGQVENADIQKIENTLSDLLALKTKVRLSKKGGCVEIFFKEFDELERFLSQIYTLQS